MVLKIGSWLVGIGCWVGATGLCFLPAAFIPHRDPLLLSAGAVLISAGMMLTATGIYLKARYWDAASAKVKSVPKKGEKVCTLCSQHQAVIQCRVHQLQLCADCLAQHYDFRSCAYVPSTRQGSSKTKAHSRASGA